MKEIDTWKALVDEKAPGLWDILYPRSYETPPGYPSLKELSYRLCLPPLMAAMDPNGEEGLLDQNIFDAYVTVARLAQEDMPTFFVTEKLYYEVLATTFSPETKLADIPWLFDGMLFIFPTNLLNSPQEGSCPFLAAARLRGNDKVAIPNTGYPEFEIPRASFKVYTCPLTPDGKPAHFASRVVLETHPTLGHIETDKLGEFTYGGMATPYLPKTEEEFSGFIAEFPMKLLMYLATYPEKLTNGAVVRPAKLTSKKHIREIRTPNVLG